MLTVEGLLESHLIAACSNGKTTSQARPGPPVPPWGSGFLNLPGFPNPRVSYRVLCCSSMHPTHLVLFLGHWASGEKI